MYIDHSASFGEKRKISLWNLIFCSAKILKVLSLFNENIYLKISNFTGKNFWSQKRIQNDRNTYENSFRIQKNFMEYLVRSQNVKFADFGFNPLTTGGVFEKHNFGSNQSYWSSLSPCQRVWKDLRWKWFYSSSKF